MLGLYALEHLIDRGMGSIPGPLKNKLKGAVATKMDAKGAAHKRELAKYAKEFSNYNKTATALQAANAAYNTAFLQAELAKKGASPLDSDTSEKFAKVSIEVGHTGLCLTNVDGVIKQYSCMDHADQQFTNPPASGAEGVKPGAGYVYLKQTSTGECVAPEGTWKNVSTKFDTFSFLRPTFVGDGKITVRKCANTREYYWKALKHGDGWMQLANLGTGQCLQFANSSSPAGRRRGRVEGVHGRGQPGVPHRRQRLAEVLQGRYRAQERRPVDLLLQPQCQGPDHHGQLRQGGASTTYGIDIRGYIRFVNRETGKCLQPAGYADGAELIEKTCTQLDYQWWNPFAVPGGWRIINAQTKKCTSYEPERSRTALMDTCADTSKMIIAPIVDPNSGITLDREEPVGPPGAPQTRLRRHARGRGHLHDGTHDSQYLGNGHSWRRRCMLGQDQRQSL